MIDIRRELTELSPSAFVSQKPASSRLKMLGVCLVYCCIGLLLGVVHCETDHDGFTLELKELLICQETEQGTNVSLYKSEILSVQANLTLCNNSSWSINQYNGFRIHARSEASSDYPVVFIARESTNGILSFGIPLQPEGFSLSFLRANRTVCPILYQNKSTDHEVTNPPPLFYIDVFTSSEEPQSYSIIVEPVENFTLELGVTYQTTITPSSPQIYYFKMPDRVKVVTIEVTTDSRRCAIVSVQNISCPVNDLLENARSKGIYQTMSTSAFLTVEASQVMDNEFVLVLIATNYSICHDRQVEPELVINSTMFTDDTRVIIDDDFYIQTLSITIQELEPISHFWMAISLPVIVFLIFYPLTFAILFGCCPLFQCVPTWDLKHPCGKPCKCVGFSEGIFCCCKNRKEESFSLVDNDNKSASTSDEQITEPQMGGEMESLYHGLEDSKSTEISAKHETDEIKLKLPRMNKRGYRELDNRYSVYGWNTITVGIFYALPAFQLVLSEQRILNLSGNEDQCYYNFKCAHPFGVLSTFNAVWSNIGYVLLGLLFILVVAVRKCMYQKQRKENKEYVDSHGIPKFFGIYYAMGIALVLEGFMSSFYHICPTDANFQFDTAFMFIIGGLLLVKVFQKRHPDIHANAFIAFFSFAIITVLTLLGIYFSRRDPLAVRLPIITLILLLTVVFLFSFYNFHEWRWGLNFVKRVLSDFKDFILCKRGAKHKARFIKLVIAFIVNLILAIVVIAGYNSIDIATAILAFFVANLLFFLIMYILAKLWFKEPFTWLALVLPLIFIVLWGAAFYFFIGMPVTNWKLTPAESRELNKDCALLDFYDNHDIWHFLSALGLFFSFLFVLVLDDGVADVKREDLHIF